MGTSYIRSSAVVSSMLLVFVLFVSTATSAPVAFTRALPPRSEETLCRERTSIGSGKSLGPPCRVSAFPNAYIDDEDEDNDNEIRAKLINQIHWPFAAPRLLLAQRKSAGISTAPLTDAHWSMEFAGQQMLDCCTDDRQHPKDWIQGPAGQIVGISTLFLIIMLTIEGLRYLWCSLSVQSRSLEKVCPLVLHGHEKQLRAFAEEGPTESQ